MSETANQAAWRAQVAAIRTITGYNIDAKNQLFMVCPGSTTTFPSYPISQLVTPQSVTPTTSTGDVTSIAAHINQEVHDLADGIPDPTSPFWSPSNNSYFSNYGTYLDSVDPGAPVNPAAYNQYMLDKPILDNAQTSYLSALSKANLAYNALSAEDQAKYSRNDWITTMYADNGDLTLKFQTYKQIQQKVYPEMRTALGPLSQTQQNYLTAYNQATNNNLQDKTLAIPGATMLGSLGGLLPIYSIDTNTWVTTWQTWSAITTPIATGLSRNPGYKWKAATTATLDLSNADSTTYANNGYTSVSVDGSVIVPEPFFFFGDGDFSTAAEKHAAYTNNNSTVTRVTINTCVTPKAFPISTGSWHMGDPATVFRQTLPTAPANLADLLHPYVNTAIVVYGVSYTFYFDTSTFSNLKTWATSNTSANAKISIFGMLFSRASASSGFSNAFESLYVNENDMSITTIPDFTGSPQLLAVVATKKPPTPAFVSLAESDGIPEMLNAARALTFSPPANGTNGTPRKGPPRIRSVSSLRQKANEQKINGHKTNGHTERSVSEVMKAKSRLPKRNGHMATAAPVMSTLFAGATQRIVVLDNIYPDPMDFEMAKGSTRGRLALTRGLILITFHEIKGIWDYKTEPNPRMLPVDEGVITAASVWVDGVLNQNTTFQPLGPSVTWPSAVGDGVVEVGVSFEPGYQFHWGSDSLVAVITQSMV